MGRREASKDSTTPIEDVASALEEIQGEGSFVARLACPTSSMTLRVEDVGPVPFPIPIAFARRLAAEASPAPYGKRDKTLLDPDVRDGWQIEASRVSVGGRSWASTLAKKLKEFQLLLGLPEEGSLEAKLDKLLLYGPGQFFASHQDSERDDTMVASLVVILPSRHQGGALVVEHAGQLEELRSAGAGKDQLALFAFYADCRHEVKPVTSGYRLALTYHLFYRSERGKRTRIKTPTSALEECVRRHFSTPVRRPYKGGPGVAPDKLVYLLDHEYTEKSLSWERLKNADRARVSALLGVASRIPCEIFLALADVHESWNTEDDYHDRRYRRDHGYEDDDEDEDEDDDEKGDVVLLDLIDSDVELRHWLDREGKPVSTISTSPLSCEICSTLESSEFQPFRSEHEGNMGNYGNTADRWYHRAAIVLWPSDREYVVRAKVSPSWAIQQAASRLKAGKRDEAVAMVGSLSPFWGGVAGRAEGKPFTSSVLGVAALLEDSDLAEMLLAPLSASNLAPKAMPLLSSLIERHGALWGRKVLSGWNIRKNYAGVRWLQELPAVVSALSSGGEEGKLLSQWLVERETEACCKSLFSELVSPRSFRASELLDDILPLLESASLLGARGEQQALVSLLARPEGGVSREQGSALLERATEARSPADVARLGLQPLYRQVMAELQRAVQRPARRQDDWSIQIKLRCGCDLCKLLQAFLESETDVKKRWPLAKDRRAHIHQQIDAYRLPVSHVTERVGSPHVLVLCKQKKLFQEEAARRTRDLAMLGRLAKLSAVYAEERDGDLNPGPLPSHG